MSNKRIKRRIDDLNGVISSLKQMSDSSDGVPDLSSEIEQLENVVSNLKRYVDDATLSGRYSGPSEHGDANDPESDLGL